MSTPYIGEIRMFGGNFAPAGWAFCDGQLIAISENDTLFNLIGTTYGGDGQETFALPNLQSRFPIHMGQGSGLQSYQIGEASGVEQVTLTTQQIPNHTHPMIGCAVNGNNTSPNGNFLSNSTVVQPYDGLDAANKAMANSSIQPQGGNQPHENMQPFLCISFIISLFGIYPSPT